MIIGQDPKNNQWFYGGRLGVGLAAGISFDYKGERPDAESSPCENGTSVGTFGSIGGSVGPYQGSIDFAGGLGSNSAGYSQGPAGNFTFGNGGGFEVGGSMGVEIIGH